MLRELVAAVARPEFEVRESVVRRVVVAVMYHFAPFQEAPDPPRHEQSVLHHIAVFAGHRDCPFWRSYVLDRRIVPMLPPVRYTATPGRILFAIPRVLPLAPLHIVCEWRQMMSVRL